MMINITVIIICGIIIEFTYIKPRKPDLVWNCTHDTQDTTTFLHKSLTYNTLLMTFLVTYRLNL